MSDVAENVVGAAGLVLILTGLAMAWMPLALVVAGVVLVLAPVVVDPDDSGS